MCSEIFKWKSVLNYLDCGPLCSEDDRDKLKEDIQELTKKYEAEATDVAKARENDVMEQS